MALQVEVAWLPGQRPVDVSYKIARLAGDVRDVQNVQRYGLQKQLEAAREASKSFQAVHVGQAMIARTLDVFDRELQGLREGSQETLEAINAQSVLLQRGFDDLVQQQILTQKLISEVADLLRHPSEVHVNELLEEADRATKSGMSSTGRIQSEEFADALRLINTALENPIGSRNYNAWFQRGWLEWHHENNLEAANEAFFKAARLSRDNPGFYYLAQWHLAAICYAQQQYEDAYFACLESLNEPDQYRMQQLYDAARYAARTHRKGELISLLTRSLEVNPATFLLMKGEEDFAQYAGEVLDLADKVEKSACSAAREDTKRSRDRLSSCASLMDEYETGWRSPSNAADLLSALENMLETASYLDALAVSSSAEKFANQTRESAEGRVASLIQEQLSNEANLTRKWDSMKSEHQDLLAHNAEVIDRDRKDRESTRLPAVGFEDIRESLVFGFWSGAAISVVYMFTFAVLWPKAPDMLKGILAIFALPFGCFGWLVWPAITLIKVQLNRSSVAAGIRESEQRAIMGTRSSASESESRLQKEGKELNANLDATRRRTNSLRNAQSRLKEIFS